LDEKPDVILFAGDYLQTPFDRQPLLLAELNDYLREIHFSAPLGMYAVSGNIDSYLWQDGFKGAGVITVPITKSFDLGDVRLTCLGLYESFNNRLKLPNPKPDRFHLVLGHTPNFALGAVTADLMLAGHTHGGQVRLPFIGPMITHSVIPHTWATGLTDLPAGGKLIVSRGIGMERGHAPPMRFLCRPELVVIDLVPEISEKEESADDRG
jgi:predicted MPP superfamily phosphohydrolase